MTTLYDPSTGRAVAIYRTDGTLVWGQESTGPVAPPRTPEPPSGPLGNIITRAETASLGRPPKDRDSFTTTTAHVAVVDATSITLAWVANKTYGPDVGGIYSGMIEVNGSQYPITIGGATTWRVEVPVANTAVTYTSDPVQVNVLKQDVIRVSMTVDADGDTGGVSSTLTDGKNGTDWSWRPARIEAPSDKTSWLCIGDSIVQMPNSYLAQACEARGLPSVTAGVGGDAHVYFPGRWGWRAAPHVAHSPHMIDQYGVNSPGKMPTAGLAFWNHAKANGVTYLVKTTIAPTTSQGAPTMNHADAQKDNAWLRDGAPLTADKKTAMETGATDPTAVRCDVIRPDGTIKKGTGGHPIDAVSDTAARIESSPGYLSDEAAAVIGSDKLHPSPAVHAMLAERLGRDLEILGF